jgi:AcrR family transcriptional regulator
MNSIRSAGNDMGSMDEQKSDPPGKLKLADSLRTLLIDKVFNSITTAEIAKTAKTNEALIYRYFGDKRGLLHHVLGEYMKESQAKILADLKSIDDPVEKLRKLVWDSFDNYNANRVFAKILLIEVRNYPGYFESDTYQSVKNYGRLIRELIEEGQESGQIRDDIPAKVIRNAVIGTIEHLALPSVIFGRQFSPNKLTDSLFQIIFEGISAKK